MPGRFGKVRPLPVWHVLLIHNGDRQRAPPYDKLVPPYRGFRMIQNQKLAGASAGMGHGPATGDDGLPRLFIHRAGGCIGFGLASCPCRTAAV